MSFANRRNFRSPLRLIVSGMSKGSLLTADWDALPTISRPQKPIGRRRSVEAALSEIHPLMNPISGQILRDLNLLCMFTHW